MRPERKSVIVRASAVTLDVVNGEVTGEIGTFIGSVVTFRFPAAEAAEIAGKLRDGHVFEIGTNVNTGPAEGHGRWFAFTVAGDEGWTDTKQALVDPGLLWMMIGEIEGIEP